MNPSIEAWLKDRYDAEMRSKVRVEALGASPVAGEIAVWHPLDELDDAPRITLPKQSELHVVWVGKERAAYVWTCSNEPGTWRELGDAGTDTDRFFLVRAEDEERVIEWMNEDVEAFESLGGDGVQVVEHPSGARLVVLESCDGNADVQAAYDASGTLVGAAIGL